MSSVEARRPGFYNWTSDEQAIREAIEAVFEGLISDVEENQLWLKSWGAKPHDAEKRKECLRGILASAPRLIPIYGHRFLLADPGRSGNPVLSVHQSDIIIYGADLRDYLLAELGELIGVSHEPQTEVEVHNIPFWGELMDLD